MNDQSALLLRIKSIFSARNSDKRAEALIAPQKRSTFIKNLIRSVPFNIAGALIFALLIYPSARSGLLVSWLIFIIVVSVLRYVLLRRLDGKTISGKQLRQTVLLALITGTLWGLTPFLLRAGPDSIALHVCVFMIAGMTAGAVIAYAGHPRATLAFNIPALGLLGGYYLWTATGYEQPLMVGVLGMYFSLTLGLARSYDRSMSDALISNIRLDKALRMVKAQAERVRALAADYASAARQANSAGEAKSVFLANMSHELRTPINGIIGLAEMMDQGMFGDLPNDMYKHYVKCIIKSANHQLNVINQILDFARLDAGRVTLEPGPFELKSAAQMVVDSLGPSAIDKELHLSLSTDERLPERVIGDESRLMQVLFNLTGNAVKFTAAGEVRVRLEVRPARKDQDGTRCRVRISVVDTGDGISKADRRRLFRRFEQVDPKEDGRRGGTGLGLAISQELVDLMGGRIHVASRVGKGTVFWFELILDRADMSAETRTPYAAAQVGAVSQTAQASQPGCAAASPSRSVSPVSPPPPATS